MIVRQGLGLEHVERRRANLTRRHRGRQVRFDQVPAAWDDTRLLAGRPGQEAVLARRSGDRWFLGGVYAGAAHTAQVPLSLGPGRWLVETIRDGVLDDVARWAARREDDATLVLLRQQAA